MTTILETLVVAEALVRIAQVPDAGMGLWPGSISVHLSRSPSSWASVARALGLPDVGEDYPRSGEDDPCPGFSTIEGTWGGCRITIHRPLRPEAERVAS